MIGSCIIDGTDIATLGAFILRGGSDDFLSFPARRTPDANDWAEHDGLDADLSECTFDAKTVRVDYYISAPTETLFKQYLNAFETLHFAPGYRQIFVKEFNRTFSLCFIGFSSYKHRGGLVKTGKKSGYLTAEYVMDDPVQQFSSSPSPGLPSGGGGSTYVKLNGTDLGAYGIIVQEVYSSALRPRTPKKRLERVIRHLDGTIADTGAAPKKQARQIVVECIMTAGPIAEFWTNYNVLFNQIRLLAPLTITAAGSVINCYYSQMSELKKSTAFSRKIRVKFNLHFQEI